MVTDTCTVQTVPEQLTSPGLRVYFVRLKHAVCWALIACTFFHPFFICWNFKEVVGPFVFRLTVREVAPGIYFKKHLQFWFIMIDLKFCFICRRSSSPLPPFYHPAKLLWMMMMLYCEGINLRLQPQSNPLSSSI